MLKYSILVVTAILIAASLNYQSTRAEEYTNDDLGISFEYPDN
jgi:hypothetical protein